MTTGPEHYEEAESLLGEVARHTNDDGVIYEVPAGDMAMLAMAQVHATLALAAAIGVGMPIFVSGEAAMPIADSDAWVEVASQATGNKADRR
jgi:hypothetical protein